LLTELGTFSSILSTLDLKVQGSEGVKHFLPGSKETVLPQVLCFHETIQFTQKDNVSRDLGEGMHCRGLSSKNLHGRGKESFHTGCRQKSSSMSYGENGARLVGSSGKRRRLFRTTPKI